MGDLIIDHDGCCEEYNLNAPAKKCWNCPRLESLVGKLNCMAGISPESPNGITYLNQAARDVIRQAAAAIRARAGS